MARSRIFKSLTARLVLVSAIVALGVYAIAQTQRSQPESAAEKQETPAPEVQTASRPNPISMAEPGSPQGGDLSAGLKQFGAKEGSFSLPAPGIATVRGQNGEAPATPDDTAASDESRQYRQPPSVDSSATPAAPNGHSRYDNARYDNGSPAVVPPSQPPTALGDGALASPPPSTGPRYGNGGDRYLPPSATADVDTEAPATLDPTAARYGGETPVAPRESLGGQATGAPPTAEASAENPLRSSDAAATTPPRLNLPPTREPYATPAVGAAPAAANSGIGVGVPGPTLLEGPQSPTLVIEKTAPAEVQVGKPATFLIKVRNAGRATAHQVIVQDEIPEGARFIDALPKPTATDDGLVLWQLGVLEPGDETVISMQLSPLNEGEIGSVATVSFQAQASVRTRSTKPELVIEQSAPTKVLLGDPVTVGIRISNPGSGSTTKVILEEDVPEGLGHTAGRQIEYEIGVLRPGEVRELELTLQAVKAGMVENLLIARGEGNLVVESRAKIEVVAPQLEVAVTGPKRRYLGRQATYTIGVMNPGTAAAKNIELIARLPRGFKYVAANNEGQYEPEAHAVYWSLDQLPEGETGQVQVSVVPFETGAQKLLVDSRAALELAASHEHVVSVEGLAELVFTVADLADPIEVGKDTLYEITVTNKGSKTAEDVVFSAVLPPQMKPLGAEGPTRWDINGQRLLFQPVARLNPKEKLTFTVQAQGLAAGDQRVRFQVESAQNQAPIIKEESTIVYSDQ